MHAYTHFTLTGKVQRMLGVGVEQRLVVFEHVVWVEHGAHLYNVRHIRLAGDAVVGHRDVRRRVEDARRNVLTRVRWRVHPDRTGLRWIPRLLDVGISPTSAARAVATVRAWLGSTATVILHCQPPQRPSQAPPELLQSQKRPCSDRP